MNQPECDAAHAQENPDSTALADPGERFSHPEHMMARVTTGRRHELGGQDRPALHLRAPGQEWAADIAFLDSISGCGATPMTSNLIHHSCIYTHERVVF